VVPAGSLKPDPSPFETCDGPFPFQAKEGVKRPGLNHFHFGPHLTERSFLVQPGFKLGHADPGGSDRDPGRSGRKRTSPKVGAATVIKGLTTFLVNQTTATTYYPYYGVYCTVSWASQVPMCATVPYNQRKGYFPLLLRHYKASLVVHVRIDWPCPCAVVQPSPSGMSSLLSRLLKLGVDYSRLTRARQKEQKIPAKESCPITKGLDLRDIRRHVPCSL
jgi:hypothetical protein